MNTIDSTVNRLSNTDAKTPKLVPVKWVKEGWGVRTITEVDEATVDVVDDQWLHAKADYLVAQWAQFLVRWEQIVAPSNFLAQ
ncbi:hypothetical protein GQ600_9018 [Phytophthora cactorum]|nr:hypothetical protein GQ600_9018 [Phytophthora cactorum]